MLNMVLCSNNVNPMMSGAACYYWQQIGLVLSYPYQGK